MYLKVLKRNFKKCPLLNWSRYLQMIYWIKCCYPKIYNEVLQLDITNKTKIPIKKWSEELNRHFPKRWIQMAKRCSISPTIREMQFKNTGCHLTPVKMAIIKKQESSVGKDGGEGNPYHYWWECKLFHNDGK